jgi:hypothetical protein
MKKALIFLGVIIAVAIVVFFLYIIFKIWTVFGFWTMVWTGLLSTTSGAILGQLIGSRSESDGKIIYNPKEWPKLVHIIICGLIGYYLYTVIAESNIEQGDFYFGLCYLILLTGFPMIWAVYTLFRDRNDYIEIDENYISYKDNSKKGKFEIAKINKIEGALTIHFNDETSYEIPLAQMNFNAKDFDDLKKDIQSRLPNIENNDLTEAKDE